MTAGWVGVFDQSFQRVPISVYPALYAEGYRVMAGYAGGGSSSKWLTEKEIKAWLALGKDTGIAALFEIGEGDAVNHPTLGDDHARAARKAWRALGYPDTSAICPAVDVNVTTTQGRGPVEDYFAAWKAADRAAIAYVEADVGSILKSAGVSVGTMTPAAFAWNSPAVLYTPSNAPAHVLWTQEHNGQTKLGKKVLGGVIDIGHIRTTAPIWWASSVHPSPPVAPPEDDVELTDKLSNGQTVDQALVAASQAASDNLNILTGVANEQPTAVVHNKSGVLGLAGFYPPPLLLQQVAGLVQSEAAIQATLAAIQAGGTSVDTAAILAAIKGVGDTESAAVAALQAAVTALQTDLDNTKAALAAALAN